MSYSTSYLSSPDQPSVVFPDRLIRPLPKRTLKSRLSQEAASSIEYPPAPPSSGLPNYAHYGESGEFLGDSKVLVQNGEVYDDHDHYHDHDEDHCPHHHHHCHHDEDEDEVESADDASPTAARNASSYRSPPRSPRTARHSRYGSAGGRGSISGPDGYEAFENTNNKKKRKIPTSGSLSLHHSSLTNELAQLGINATRDGSADDHAAYSMAGSSGLGVQGAGRGHYARKSASRRPLGVSVNGSNLRSGTAKYDQNMAANAKAEDSKDQGIISAAIANATALLRKPLGKGQENVGVLDQQSKQVAANSQFTFTCESDAKGVTFPEQSLYSSSYTQRGGNLPPPGASGSGQRMGHPQNAQAANAAAQQAQQAASAQGPAGNAAGKKPRRRRGDVYTLAARQRRLQQEYTNIQRPPAPEDIWICEFCEYESIFGQPPRALIRQYEIKDRKERRRLAEKKRLLDKARRRGKKAAKSSKNANKNNHAAQAPAHQQEYDQPLDQLGDDDLDYPYDEDPEPVAVGAPAAAKQPGTVSNDISGKGGGTGDGGGVR